MQPTPLSLMQFQKKFGTEKACQKHLFHLRWPEGFRCPRCQHNKAYFHRSRHLYHCKACGYQASLTAGTVFHKTRTPLHKWFWMIWLMGRQKSGISMLSLQRMLEIKTYKSGWTMGHKIRQALADRDANYKLAGLMEMADTCFWTPNPGKRGRGAAGKAKVVVAVETPTGKKPRFADLRLMPRVSLAEIWPWVRECLAAEVLIKTDGWQGYSFLDASPGVRHEWLVPDSGKQAPKVR
jgi:transposase-like protein